MKRPWSSVFATSALLLAGLANCLPCWAQDSSRANRYIRHDLVSNDTSRIPADHEDSSLLNPWGNVFPLGGPFWINDNGSGISALYQGDGTQVSRAGTALKVTIPPPQGGTPPSAPTGIVR